LRNIPTKRILVLAVSMLGNTIEALHAGHFFDERSKQSTKQTLQNECPHGIVIGSTNKQRQMAQVNSSTLKRMGADSEISLADSSELKETREELSKEGEDEGVTDMEDESVEGGNNKELDEEEELDEG
jgi:hypothetical protein